MNALLIILASALLIWIIGTLLAIRGIEEPKYELVEKKDGYEIREYASYIVAEVEIEWDMKTALNQGFRLLAGYIFGENTQKESVKMTVPVMEMSAWMSESIKMTVPVIESLASSGKRIIAFTMPSKYTLDTLPKPSNANIWFRTVEKSRRAVLQYSWYATEARVDQKKKLLTNALIRDGFNIKWEIISAQYNPPLSFPPLRRNEVMVDIK